MSWTYPLIQMLFQVLQSLNARSAAEATLLSAEQVAMLRELFADRLIALCFGAGVDSTALIVALKCAGVRPSVITFADTGGEKPERLQHADRINEVLESWGWPLITTVRKRMLASTPYSDLYGNCWENETLPSLAFGMKSCSIKFKAQPQDYVLQGAQSGPNACEPHPVWIEAQVRATRIVKLIGYDAGAADKRRSKKLPMSDDNFDYCYPLQLLGWARAQCVSAIARVLGAHMVPIKSACFFCPASKHWELYWLAAFHPELFESALALERRALTGRHSRFDAIEFGGKTWEEMIRTSDRFPSTKTTVGLGRSFAWKWARVNLVVDADFRVIQEKRELFIALANQLRGDDNALDQRSCAPAPGEVAGLAELAEALA